MLFVLGLGVSALDYRPVCNYGITNVPFLITNHYPDGQSFLNGLESGIHGTYNICPIDSTTFFVKYDYGYLNGLFFKDSEDLYSTNIGGQSNALKANLGFNVYFEYYYPSNNGTCELTENGRWYSSSAKEQQIFFNNVNYANANCGGCSDFADAKYVLSGNELTCDTWHTFELPSSAFENEFGVKDRLVSFGFQMTNVYIRNIFFTRSGVNYKLY